MKKKILIADKDASLKEAFRIIFSEDKYEIFYAPSAKEVERIVATDHPEIYIVNVSLVKSSGIEVYKKLQKDKLLDGARFFFMKDENDSTELLGFQAEGVIEKPINFFKVHERIAKDDDLIVLTDEMAEPEHQTLQRAAERAGELATKEALVKEGIDVKTGIEGLASGLSGHAAVNTEEMAPALEAELRRVLSVTMEEMVPKFVDRMTPVLSTFVEDYTRRVLYEIAEKVIREEIDKLLKESAS
ncbi:MAG TPA: response regulator [Syntrophorhabdales bacterium]|nr:response regulator [Syntrophorhabdales bacterium]